MNKEVLKQQLKEEFDQALELMIQAVELAPDGQWLAASEWQVRQAGQELTQRCYQALVQARLDQTPPAVQKSAAFSPGVGSSPALQGQTKHHRAQRRR